MNPEDPLPDPSFHPSPRRRNLKKDAIFLSGHKFVGGPGTPGVLVVKRGLMRADAVPERPGGGTVFFVQEHGHRYLGCVESRNGGGGDGWID